jgi:hypothetical protein
VRGTKPPDVRPTDFAFGSRQTLRNGTSANNGQMRATWIDCPKPACRSSARRQLPAWEGIPAAAAEAKFRRSLREAEESAERQRIAIEKRRHEQLAARNRERIAHLLQSGALLRQAQDIRAVVADLQTALTEAGFG